jgi:DNA polymerase III delta prime subunit
MSSFSAIEAQSRTWSLLTRSHRAGRLGSAYLICGAEGYGHWPFALAVAALLNCEKVRAKTADEPCGECRACRLISAANFEGLQVIAPVKTHKNLGEAVELTAAFIESRRKEPFGLLDTSAPVTVPIDMARELKRSLAQKASAGVHRVALLYRIDRMKAEGTDSLLKLIEEPPTNTTILLTAVNPEEVSATIQSRCRNLVLEPVPESSIIEYLTTRYKLSSERAKLLARISDRDLGRAIALAGNDDEDGSDRAVGLLLFKSLFMESSPSMIGRLTELMADADRGQAEDLVRLWGSLIRDCTAYAATGNDGDLINVDFAPDIKRLSGYFADPDVANEMAEALKNTLADFRVNVHIHPTLAALALRLQSALPTQA